MASRQLSSVRARLYRAIRESGLPSPAVTILENRLLGQLLAILGAMVALGLALQWLSTPDNGFAVAAGWVGVYAFGLSVFLVAGLAMAGALRLRDGWKHRRARRRTRTRRGA